MGKIAVVFSGQGAQKVGMCQDIYEKYDLAKKTFDCFSQIKNDLKQVCFESDEETLMKTINTQPCLYATQVAIFNVFNEIISQKNIKIEGFAGFSLGEIAALYASGVYSFDDGFKIVCQRASLMQMCADKTDGAMVACLK
ncbi:MAG: ACP S-malonyltransferase, partial [Clostridia bacterium]